MQKWKWFRCLIAVLGTMGARANVPTVESNSGNYAMESTTMLLGAAKTAQSSSLYTLAPGLDSDSAANAVQASDWALYE